MFNTVGALASYHQSSVSTSSRPKDYSLTALRIRMVTTGASSKAVARLICDAGLRRHLCPCYKASRAFQTINEHPVLRRGLFLPRPRTGSQVFVLFTLMV